MTDTATTLDALDQTATALDAGVTSMYPSAAMQSIAHWEQRCRADGGDALTAVADGLVILREALSQDRLDGRTIGTALLDVADATAAAATTTEDAHITSKLERIIVGLRRAGTALGGHQG
ncbi:MAG: hypothetical protein AAGG50_03300 [Bacteroidota bacterium]